MIILLTEMVCLEFEKKGHNMKMNKKRQIKISDRVTSFSQLPEDALLSAREITQLTGRSRTSIWRDVNSKRLPVPVALGMNTVRWTVRDIKSYLSGLSVVTK